LVINAFAHIGLYCAVGEILAARVSVEQTIDEFECEEEN